MNSCTKPKVDKERIMAALDFLRELHVNLIEGDNNDRRNFS